MKARIVCAALLITRLCGGVSRASDDDPRAAAAAHYARGLELANQGQYEAALDEFNAAYSTSPHFAVMYNVGQTYLALGKSVEAIAALTKYLRDGTDQVPLSRREQVQAQIALLESKLAELSIATDQPGAMIRVDGREIGRTPLFQPLRLAAGTHAVTASLPDGAQVTRQVTLGEAERQKLDLIFVNRGPATANPVSQPSPPAVSAASAPTQGVVAETPGVAVRRASYVITGAGLVAAGAALGVYLWNRGRYDDWQSTNTALQTAPSGTPSYHQRAVANNQLADSLTTANHEILALSIAAGALVATGVTLYLVDRAHRRRSGELAIGWGRTGPAGSSASLCWSLTW